MGYLLSNISICIMNFKGNGITTGDESYCRWISQGHGVFHECAPSEVLKQTK